MLRVPTVEAGLGAIALRGLRAEPARLHKPRDPTPTHPPPGVAQRALKPWTAVPLLVRGEERRDLGREVPVLFRVRALAAAPPGVKPGGAHPVAATERAHAEARADRRALRGDERGDEREDLAFRAEQNRMAFFRRSCSSLRSA
jgi:hypothetical protein